MDDFNYNDLNYSKKDSDDIKNESELKDNNEQSTLGAYNGTPYNGNSNQDLKASSFYTESYSKPKKKNGILGQLILVAVMSSILGGSIVGGFFAFGVPAMQPSVRSFFGDRALSGSGENVEASKEDSGIYKKVVIENASSPVVAIAEKVGPAVVGISINSKVVDDFFFFAPRDAQSQGSGIIIRSDGYIMTNNHVIEQALVRGTNDIDRNSKIEVILPSDKSKTYPAKVIGRDERTDLAVLKIESNNLPAVEFGNSDDVKVGELAVAIGNPGGLEYMGSVTVGVISGLNRTIPIADGKELKLIQTDASINPGNSGGALVNAEGKLIGVNTAKIGGDGYEGLGFAIPINKAKEITDSLIEFKYVKGRPSLGIEVDPRFNEQMAKQYDVPAGVLVYDVIPLSSAYKAGIQRNDIITKFDGVKVKSLDELNEQKNKKKPGDKANVEVYRDGKTLNIEVVLGEEK
ncbi:MAG: S1C family serine protease [Bacillota bacterium]